MAKHGRSPLSPNSWQPALLFVVWEDCPGTILLVRNIRYENIYKGLLDGHCNSSPVLRFTFVALFISHIFCLTAIQMAHSEPPFDRQFHVDPATSQTFFWEHIEGTWGMWKPLAPSDFHPPHPASHNIGVFTNLCPIFITNCSRACHRFSRRNHKIPWVSSTSIPPSNTSFLLPQLNHPRGPETGIPVRVLLPPLYRPNLGARGTQDGRRGVIMRTIPFTLSSRDPGGEGLVEPPITDLAKLRSSWILWTKNSLLALRVGTLSVPAFVSGRSSLSIPHGRIVPWS